ncbi:glycoside hydrolase [Phyllosticta citriasiana]|uniref:alpha-1,2-Mannosidase n=1 Tax=Phyllosticta citriasiana TaxID=595635 RepID=A0ABR1KXY1_9PEZI
MGSFRRTPTPAFQLLSAVIIITFYLIYVAIHGPSDPDADVAGAGARGPEIQHRPWNGASGRAQEERAAQVREAMKYTFGKYKEHAWGFDDILPVSGGHRNSRNGWGAFIVDSASTLALMGMWDELNLCLERIVNVPFYSAQGLVDPFETTIRYLGGLVSIIDLSDAGVIPKDVMDLQKRTSILSQAVLLADKLGPSFDSPTGMIWPRVDFATNKGKDTPDEVYLKNPHKIRYEHPAIGPARAGSNILEYRTLSRLTTFHDYFANATRAWSGLVWDEYVQDPVGLIDGPIDIFTGDPVGRERHWDAGHDSYYEYLIKAAILAPHDRYSKTYSSRWMQAVHAMRHNLTTRSSYTTSYATQHLFLGKFSGPWYLNEQSTLACFAPGNLLLGAKYLNRPDISTLGLALLEGCRHSYNATTTGIGPEIWSWIPMSNLPNATFLPQTPREERELAHLGFWAADPRFRLRPEYVESLFYAWRITGQQRYRDWAWDAFVAYEKHCKTDFGYASIADVNDGFDTGAGKPKPRHLDEAESFWTAETLKYLYLTFADVEVGSLDRWVYNTEGHPMRMIR